MASHKQLLSMHADREPFLAPLLLARCRVPDGHFFDLLGVARCEALPPLFT